MEIAKCIFNDDPMYMKSLVGQAVAVTTVENTIHSGVVYVIDPESKTVVLATKKDVKTDLDFILYDSIKCLEVTSTVAVDQTLLFEDEPNTITEETRNKKAKLKEWLKMNLIDVEEVGSVLKLSNHVTIESPYGPDQCFCNNTIVLDRIRTIMSRMPAS